MAKLALPWDHGLSKIFNHANQRSKTKLVNCKIMKVFIYIVLLIAPLNFMYRTEHYSKMYKNILVAIVVWFFQINVMSFEIKFDIYKLGYTKAFVYKFIFYDKNLVSST